MGLLIYPLIQGREAGWPVWTYLMVAGSAASFAALGLWGRRERRRGRDPLIEASIFKHRAYSAGLGTIVVFFGGMIGTLLVLTLFLQLGEHFSAIHAGVTLAPFAARYRDWCDAGGRAAGAQVRADRAPGGMRDPGRGRAVAAPHGASPRSRHQHADAIAPQLVVGIGMGMMVSPLFHFILASVTDTEVGSASGVLNAVQQLGGAIGVAAIGTLFFSTLAHSGS